MAGINLAALKNLNEELVDRTNLDSDVVYSSKLGPETDFRVTPPEPALNGVPYYEIFTYFIKGKPYLSLESFGEDCPITEEIAAAKLEKDLDLDELLEDDKNLQKKGSWLVAGLFLDCEFDDDGGLKSFKVKDKKGRILSAPITLIKGINRELSSRAAGKDATDRVTGKNVLITKSGAGLKTEYNARLWDVSTEMPEEFYEADKMPTIMGYLDALKKSPNYLRGIIRNYLYGEDLPKEDKKEDKPTRTKDAEKATSSRGGSGRGAAPAATGRGAAAAPASTGRGGRAATPATEEAEQDENDFKAAPAKAEKPAAGGKKSRSLLNDIE